MQFWLYFKNAQMHAEKPDSGGQMYMLYLIFKSIRSMHKIIMFHYTTKVVKFVKIFKIWIKVLLVLYFSFTYCLSIKTELMRTSKYFIYE